VQRPGANIDGGNGGRGRHDQRPRVEPRRARRQSTVARLFLKVVTWVTGTIAARRSIAARSGARPATSATGTATPLGAVAAAIAASAALTGGPAAGGTLTGRATTRRSATGSTPRRTAP
jgi:hypothetical protein